jgi:hypothetical protein
MCLLFVTVLILHLAGITVIFYNIIIAVRIGVQVIIIIPLIVHSVILPNLIKWCFPKNSEF